MHYLLVEPTLMFSKVPCKTLIEFTLRENGNRKSSHFYHQTVHGLCLVLPPCTAAANLVGDVALTAHKNSCVKDDFESNCSCKDPAFIYFLVCFHFYRSEFVLAYEAFLCYKKTKKDTVKSPALPPITLPLFLPNTLVPEARVFCLLLQC